MASSHDNDPNEGLGLIDAVEQIFKNVARVNTYLKGKIARGHVVLALIILVTLALGGLSWNFIRPVKPSPTVIGIIYNATIANAPYEKEITGHPGQSVIVDIKVPKGSCHVTVTTDANICDKILMGSSGNSCPDDQANICVQLIDVDAPELGKTNDITLHTQLQNYYNVRVAPEIMFAGKRDTFASDFPNILLINPPPSS